MTILVAAWWLVLFALDVSGKNLGEVARLWILLMPFATLGAAIALESFGNIRWQALVLQAALAYQTVVLVTHVQGFFDPQSIKPAEAVLSRGTGFQPGFQPVMSGRNCQTGWSLSHGQFLGS